MNKTAGSSLNDRLAAFATNLNTSGFYCYIMFNTLITICEASWDALVPETAPHLKTTLIRSYIKFGYAIINYAILYISIF